jgi:hypothetical protein
MDNDPGVSFLNLSYFFRMIYDLFFGVGTPDVGVSGILVFLAQLWAVVTVLAVLVALFAIGVLVYSTMRLFQIREEEKSMYTTVTQYDEHERLETSRWQYIQQRIASTNEDDWRAAIIEADIILDEVLTRLGYQGSSVGEKLKAVNPAHFGSLQNAWEAHKVRNDIAHQGSTYPLTDRIAYRTIQNYEAVFREHEEL